MQHQLDPSDLYHSFTPQRLGIVARVLWETRVLASSTALWDDGANKLSVGLNAWLFACKRLTTLSAAGTYDWLSVASEGAHFIIRLGGCPLRFCSGDDESPLREGYRQPSARERSDLQLKFASSELARDGIFFRLLVESGPDAMPTAVYLAECDLKTGEILNAWQIRLSSDEGDSGVPVVISPKPPVVLPGLRVETHEEADAREREERERDEKRSNTTNQRGA